MTSDGSHDLNTEVIEQVFETSEKIPTSKERLKSKKTGNIIEYRQLYKQQKWILSGPLENVLFKEERTDRTYNL